MTIDIFINVIKNFYKQNKRAFPWRETTDPYKILVSELMLQQTQTYRVLPKYEQFIEKFPTIKTLGEAELATVLELWSGLGYNRRARFLHQAAKYINQKYRASFPRTVKELQEIPGIGPYTAAAILVFAFNQPLVFIETNIRRVYIHHFFNDQTNISDKELFPYIEQTVDKKNPREWYYALMDYGSEMVKKIPNPNRKSKHYSKQSKFEGSLRKIRGEIMRQLIKHKELTPKQLFNKIPAELPERIIEAFQSLEKDELIKIQNNILTLS